MKHFFIHIPKNGGTTIRIAPELSNKILDASPNYHKDWIYTKSLEQKMREIGDHYGYEHARWQDLNKLAQSMRAFAIIRNPWDRVVSRYFFAKKVIEIEKKVPKSYADVSSFEAFLEERHKWGNQEFMWHRAVRGWYPAFDYVVDPITGKIAKNIDILRFEKYNEDTKRYFNLKNNLKPRNVTALNKRSYKDIYNKKTIQIIADWYKIDIDTWGYDFDTGPTKNYWNMK